MVFSSASHRLRHGPHILSAPTFRPRRSRCRKQRIGASRCLKQGIGARRCRKQRICARRCRKQRIGARRCRMRRIGTHRRTHRVCHLMY